MNTRKIVLIAVFAAVIAVLAPISIPMWPVPLTMQTLIIPLIASLTIASVSIPAVAVYLILGIIGLPVYANWSAGATEFLGPTGGYLLGMLVFPIVISLGMGRSRSLFKLTILNIIAALLQLLVGTLWLTQVAHLTFAAGFATGFITFVLPALIKVVLVVFLTVLIRQRLTTPLGLANY